MLRTRLLLVSIVVLSFASACSKNDGRIKVYPVEGKVLVRGVPAQGAQVVFYPVSEELKKRGMPVPDGVTDSQGSFKLRSYTPGDGAPEGKYMVSVVWLEPLPPGANQESVSAKDRLGGRYLDPQKSNLTAKVEPGGGAIPPFEIQ